jgi:hypothetical protein
MLMTLAAQVAIGPPECTRPRESDMRPYTLCLAETENDAVEAALRRQLATTLRRVRASGGTAAAARLRTDQRRWDVERHRRCAGLAGEAPVPEQARAELTCLSMAATPRTAVLARRVRRR